MGVFTRPNKLKPKQMKKLLAFLLFLYFAQIESHSFSQHHRHHDERMERFETLMQKYSVHDFELDLKFVNDDFLDTSRVAYAGRQLQQFFDHIKKLVIHDGATLSAEGRITVSANFGFNITKSAQKEKGRKCIRT